jgi:hypothetical protein
LIEKKEKSVQKVIQLEIIELNVVGGHNEMIYKFRISIGEK